MDKTSICYSDQMKTFVCERKSDPFSTEVRFLQFFFLLIRVFGRLYLHNSNISLILPVTTDLRVNFIRYFSLLLNLIYSLMNHLHKFNHIRSRSNFCQLPFELCVNKLRYHVGVLTSGFDDEITRSKRIGTKDFTLSSRT